MFVIYFLDLPFYQQNKFQIKQLQQINRLDNSELKTLFKKKTHAHRKLWKKNFLNIVSGKISFKFDLFDIVSVAVFHSCWVFFLLR